MGNLVVAQFERHSPQRLKPLLIWQYGTAEAVPFQNAFKLTHYRKFLGTGSAWINFAEYWAAQRLASWPRGQP